MFREMDNGYVKLSGKTLSFDGKIVFYTSKMKSYKNPLHIVITQIAELGITFAQKNCRWQKQRDSGSLGTFIIT
jgi:hypothetical protein